MQNILDQYSIAIGVDTLGNPYYKRVPFHRIPEYRDFVQKFQILKPTAEIAVAEPTLITNYPNGYKHTFGCRRARSMRSVQYHNLRAGLQHAR
jgi:hypothetical protein